MTDGAASGFLLFKGLFLVKLFGYRGMIVIQGHMERVIKFAGIYVDVLEKCDGTRLLPGREP